MVVPVDIFTLEPQAIRLSCSIVDVPPRRRRDEHPPSQSAVPTWVSQNSDPEENVATGAWRGSASDLESMLQRGRMKEISVALESLGREGQCYRLMESESVRAAVRDAGDVSARSGSTAHVDERINSY